MQYLATQERGIKQYELTDHLGNIRTVVGDIKEPHLSGLFRAPTQTLNNYYPYGMLQSGRSVSTGAYRFGYQGQEADNKIGGLGQHTTAQFWEYDTWAVKRWNTDPVTYPWQSTYATFNNNPILFSDPLGLYGSEKRAQKMRQRAISAGWNAGEVYQSKGRRGNDEHLFNISNPNNYKDYRTAYKGRHFESTKGDWTDQVVSSYQSGNFFAQNPNLNSQSYLFTSKELDNAVRLQLNLIATLVPAGSVVNGGRGIYAAWRAGNFARNFAVPAAIRAGSDFTAQTLSSHYLLHNSWEDSFMKANLIESALAGADISFGATALISANYSITGEDGFQNTLLDKSTPLSTGIKNVAWQTSVGLGFGKISSWGNDGVGGLVNPMLNNPRLHRTTTGRLLRYTARSMQGLHAATDFTVGVMGEKIENGDNPLWTTEEKKAAQEEK